MSAEAITVPPMAAPTAGPPGVAAAPSSAERITASTSRTIAAEAAPTPLVDPTSSWSARINIGTVAASLAAGEDAA